MYSSTLVLTSQRIINRFKVLEAIYSDNVRIFSLGTDALESFVISEIGKEFLRKKTN